MLRLLYLSPGLAGRRIMVRECCLQGALALEGEKGEKIGRVSNLESA